MYMISQRRQQHEFSTGHYLEIIVQNLHLTEFVIKHDMVQFLKV